MQHIVNLVNKVKKIIENEKLIEEGDKVLIGVSGGIDSTALLYVLSEISKKIDFKIGLVHLNHQLRGEESTRDEQFIEGLARQFSLPIYTKKADVKGYAKIRGISLQHAGRDLRYAFFEEIASAYVFNKIAIAHNLDDQAETFLLRMLKGTGVRGLSSIPVKRDRIVRPFLNIYRSEIERYATDHSMMYVEDSSNRKTIYERNFIRKQIIPLMETRNPFFKEKVVMLLQDITAINSLYNGKAEEFLKKEQGIENGDILFEVDALKGVDEETRFRVFVSVFSRIERDFVPLREHARLINNIILSEKPNLTLAMPHGIRIKRVYNRLIFTKKPVPQKMMDIFPISLGENRLKPFGLALDVSLILHSTGVPHPTDRYIAYFDGDQTGDLSVRTFTNGDRFIPLGMKAPVKLKDYFISKKIPKEERSNVPLLMSGDDIIWVIGHRISEIYKVSEVTKKALKVSVKNLMREK